MSSYETLGAYIKQTVAPATALLAERAFQRMRAQYQAEARTRKNYIYRRINESIRTGVMNSTAARALNQALSHPVSLATAVTGSEQQALDMRDRGFDPRFLRYWHQKIRTDLTNRRVTPSTAKLLRNMLHFAD